MFFKRVVSKCAAALPMVERVGLVTGDFRVLGGEGEADLPGKKKKKTVVVIDCARTPPVRGGRGGATVRSTVSMHPIFS